MAKRKDSSNYVKISTMTCLDKRTSNPQITMTPEGKEKVAGELFVASKKEQFKIKQLEIPIPFQSQKVTDASRKIKTKTLLDQTDCRPKL